MNRRSLRKQTVKKVNTIFAFLDDMDNLCASSSESASANCKPVEYLEKIDLESICDSDDDDIGNVSTSLTESLCNWAVHFRVSLVALTALLAILWFIIQKMLELF